ncbi:hypothetical protein I3842_13G062900 [Carya illinoinensis]|uniref:B3 domain-containing transcription repressor VAL1 n=1 Tax=Carya illinoinensis TaxID=32201 RepID=A0A922DCF9_CARIL|nr:hypothetical protein I3842_13G062900 [Carya illinoinensis]KAG6680852.1 hypothetical protein I3842_13G062900 [Carya illinoinensis]KAG6680853.1 hypothetical protein I3842_13G062900 [Carya illinoinensis]
MGPKSCMNASCGATSTHEWKRGWPLRSGGFSDLCHNCGSAYEDLVFCDMFHLEETGWRECSLCNKRIHCGCIISEPSYEYLDFGGVGCNNCVKSSGIYPIWRGELSNGFGLLTVKNAADSLSSPFEKRLVSEDEGRLMQLCKIMEADEPNLLPQSERGEANASQVGLGFSNVTQPSIGSAPFTKTDNSRQILEGKDMHESLAKPSLNMTLGTPNFVFPFSGGVVDGREQSKTPSPIQQGQRSRPILPKPTKTTITVSSETNKSVVQMRIARPPAEGRGKNQLLPRYWPRITDQELEQLSGDLNSTIVPLFEKVLSASDAGRIGRLVLPKACAEAYFPHISQSEGLPLRIQDVKGNDWTFQFRFWPNNNSRMYVLEGVTPCIQSMELRAGDTVTFSRIDPGGKLVLGFRKASNTADSQDAQMSALPNGTPSRETSFAGVIESLPSGSGYSGIFQTMKGSKEPHLNALCENLHLGEGDIGVNKCDNHGDRINKDSPQQPMHVREKKRTRNIGFKSKRLLMHSEESLELRLTWEEAQDLLRPPSRVKPSIVTIEDHEFEEYDEPPVFGKRTIFTALPSRGPVQWAQCDDCSKWRRLPVDVLLPPKWTCSENVWDSNRCFCSVPEEISLKQLVNLLRVRKDFTKRRSAESHMSVQEREPSGLDALACAAVLGDNVGDLGEPSVGATTKHPRHRPGCTCIVCIQPPSGKGKHKPTCTCNVCMTVKRRFKTLMLRKKKRQSEREAETAQKDDNHLRDESKTNGPSRDGLLPMNYPGNEESHSGNQLAELAEIGNGQIDLNCHPKREDMQLDLEVPGMSLQSLVQAASLPLEDFMKQRRIPTLTCEQLGSLDSCIHPQLVTGESERPGLSDEGGPCS